MSAKVKDITPKISESELKEALALVERLRAGKYTKEERERHERWDREREEAERTGFVVLTEELSK